MSKTCYVGPTDRSSLIHTQPAHMVPVHDIVNTARWLKVTANSLALLRDSDPMKFKHLVGAYYDAHDYKYEIFIPKAKLFSNYNLYGDQPHMWYHDNTFKN